jgi:para-nitrobenzyl esterase
VLVHIHGGGFRIGSGAEDNSLLAARGHEIVVSINYRLGILGFLANSALGEHSGDYGLQDQQAALRWVRDNISAFGGDPRNVTIYGESAGGSSACHHIASPTAAGLFHRAISVSGEYNTLLGVPAALEAQDCKSALPTQAQADQAGARFAASLGCASAADVAECLRAAPVASVLTASGGTRAPTINATILPTTLRQALKTGKVNRVPVIAGVNRDENLVGSATTPEQYRALVEAQYGRFAPDVLELYPLERFDSPFIAFRTVSADSNTVCPALVTARGLARWMRVYAYQLDDTDAPRTSPFFPPPGVPNGSYHVGGWFLTPVNPPLNENQQVLQNQEIAHVTAFARTGDPTAVRTPIWPRFTAATQAVMSLQPAGDSEIVTADALSAQHHCRFWDRVGAAPR